METEKTWLKILQIIKDEVSAANFRTWFSKTKMIKTEGEKLTLAVPSAFIKGQLATRYESLIASSVEKTLGKSVSIDYVIDPSEFEHKKRADEEDSIFQFAPSTSYIPATLTLNPKYRLENFVVGLTNNLAYAAAQAITQNPGTSYNPLFIYGPSGVGKTHIMQGIGNAIISRSPYAKVIYASSEKFMNDLVDSIQNRKTGDFRQKYRSCDVLLVDDVQFISGKDSTQEEFFHTFNELQSKNAQIVLTSDRTPTEMQKLESRLVSRFQGGLMVDIQLPDFDTRVAILKAKLNERREALPEECIKLIAENVESNTRELEGKLIQIVSMVKMTSQEPTLDMVRKFLGRPQQSHGQNIDHKKVLAGINQYFNIKMSDLTGPRRQKGLVLPRQIAMFIMYDECNIPMEKIGQILGGRDHTTVLHGIDKIRGAISRDREVQRMVVEIRQQLGS